jgi:hypothetical protein
MLLLHLDSGGYGEVPIWTWRLARMISEAISRQPSLPVMLCVVTSAVSAIHNGATDDDGSNPFAMERARILSQIKSAAVRSDSFLKLEPLTRLAQHSYALQVLRAKFAYAGSLDGVPDEVLNFVVSRSGGKPVFIEQMLDVLEAEELLHFVIDEDGYVDAGAEIVEEVGEEVLDALPTPQNIRSEVLQLFESLDPALQTSLRLAAPMEAFSEAMLTDVGLPGKIVRRLAQLFNMAVDEGILEAYLRAIPQEVLEADPTATQAWGWRMGLLRTEVLQGLLASEVQRVERKIEDRKTFHRARVNSTLVAGGPQGSPRPHAHLEPALALSDIGRGMRRTSTYEGRRSSRGGGKHRMSSVEPISEVAQPVWRLAAPKPQRKNVETHEQAVQCDLGAPGTGRAGSSLRGMRANGNARGLSWSLWMCSRRKACAADDEDGRVPLPSQSARGRV